MRERQRDCITEINERSSSRRCPVTSNKLLFVLARKTRESIAVNTEVLKVRI